MATASNSNTSHFETIRSKIHVSIESAIKLLRDRETSLINQLDTLQTEYPSQTAEIILQSSDETILRVNNTNKQIDICYKFNEQLYRGIEGIAKLEIRTRTVTVVNKQTIPDYTTKILPTKSCFKKNVTDTPVIGEFKTPWGLAIEPNSGNIYISDRSHYCVQVFDRDCKFLYKFSLEMGGPVGMCFSLNRIIITQWGKNYITAHDMKGLLLDKIGKKGNGELEFNSPWGITASDVTGDVYICERENHRVQILNESLEFKMFLGEGEFKEPRDVKLTKDEISVCMCLI